MKIGGEKMQKKKSMVITACGLTLAMLLITSNFGVIFAQTENNVTLPDYLERLLQSIYANATKAELDQKRIEWANQEKINEEHRKTASPPSGKDAHYYMINADVEYWGDGMVYNEDNIIGSAPDSAIAKLYTPYVGGVANIFGEMSSSDAWGYVYAYAAEYGQRYDGKDNYLCVMASNDLNAPPEEWAYLGYQKITSTTPDWCYIAYTSNEYQYWCFGVNAMGVDCMYNYISIDCTAVTHA
jgi:hypothetical protein